MKFLNYLLFCLFLINGFAKAVVPEHAKLQDFYKKNQNGQIAVEQIKNMPKRLGIVSNDGSKILRIVKPDDQYNVPRAQTGQTPEIILFHNNQERVRPNEIDVRNTKWVTQAPLLRKTTQAFEIAKPNYYKEKGHQGDPKINHNHVAKPTTDPENKGCIAYEVKIPQYHAKAISHHVHDEQDKMGIFEDDGNDSVEKVDDNIQKEDLKNIVLDLVTKENSNKTTSADKLNNILTPEKKITQESTELISIPKYQKPEIDTKIYVADKKNREPQSKTKQTDISVKINENKVVDANFTLNNNPVHDTIAKDKPLDKVKKVNSTGKFTQHDKVKGSERIDLRKNSTSNLLETLKIHANKSDQAGNKTEKNGILIQPQQPRSGALNLDRLSSEKNEIQRNVQSDVNVEVPNLNEQIYLNGNHYNSPDCESANPLNQDQFENKFTFDCNSNWNLPNNENKITIQHFAPDYTYAKPPFQYPCETELTIDGKTESQNNEKIEVYKNDRNPFYTYTKITSLDGQKKIWKCWNNIQINFPENPEVLGNNLMYLSQLVKEGQSSPTPLNPIENYNQNSPKQFTYCNNYPYHIYQPFPQENGPVNNFYPCNKYPQVYNPSYNSYQSQPFSYYGYQNNLDY